MKGSKSIAGTLVVALMTAGPLMPGAMAQTQPPPPPPMVQPAPPPMVQPAPPPPIVQPAPLPPPMPVASPMLEPGRGAEIGAKVLNVVHVPGKAILCGAGTVAGAVFMLATFGVAYGAAVELFNEGCGGPWFLTPYDVSSIRPPEDR